MRKFEERPMPKIQRKGPSGVDAFYKSLGWREGLVLDKNKVAIHPDDYANICMELALTKSRPARLAALGMWLYCGPKPDPKVRRSTLRLYPGCFTDKQPA